MAKAIKSNNDKMITLALEIRDVKLSICALEDTIKSLNKTIRSAQKVGFSVSHLEARVVSMEKTLKRLNQYIFLND
jgi:predicted  nucleic acid-binding Zn-ribbon protein